MGRLIDEMEIYKRLRPKTDNGTLDEIMLDIPTVEAIPKAEYEARLKADMVAMLTEIQLECEENTVRWYVGRVDGKSDDVVLIDTLNDIIQQKINALKENTDGQTND